MGDVVLINKSDAEFQQMLRLSKPVFYHILERIRGKVEYFRLAHHSFGNYFNINLNCVGMGSC